VSTNRSEPEGRPVAYCQKRFDEANESSIHFTAARTIYHLLTLFHPTL